MTPIMTPSAEQKKITAGQVDKAVANYRALLEKHSGNFSSEAVQLVLSQDEIVKEQFAVFRRRVDIVSNPIVRRVRVNRNLTPQEALSAAAGGRAQYINQDILNTLPKGEGDEVDVCFFKPEPWEYTSLGYISDEDFDKALKRRGLVDDPRAMFAVNGNEYLFADDKPNATHWKDASGHWHYAAFHRVAFRSWDTEDRGVVVGLNCNGWNDFWMLSGVRT